mgnify:CR=1 FL=1
MSIVINKAINIIHTYESNEPRQGQNILFTNKILRSVLDAIGAKLSAPLTNHDIV